MKHLKFFSFLLWALLSSSLSFAQIQADWYLTLDSCRSVTNTSAVHAGKAPLTQAYQGEGVIVGIIDGGLQYNHPAFRDNNGQLRIRKVWDFDENGKPIVLSDPQAILARKFSYGSCYGFATTNHASHVAGIAASSGRYKGMAPASEIIFADFIIPMERDSLVFVYQRQLIKCIRDMYAYADSVGKPIVINISLGQNIGFSTELAALQKEFETLTSPGHILLSSAGNEGNVKEAAHYFNSGTNTSAEAVLSIMPVPMTNKLYVRSADSVELALTVPAEQKEAYQTSYVRLPDAPDGKKVYRLDITPKAEPAQAPFRMVVNANGKAPFEYFTVLCGIAASNTPGCTISNDYSVGIPASYPNVIAVANYAVEGSEMKMADASSWGPTWDGRNKPDVTAVGSVISAGNYYSPENTHDVVEAYPMDGKDSLETWCGQFGTSQASPMMAGIVALWLQANPKLTPEDIFAVINKTAKPLEQIPNNKSGAGMVDAYAGLLEVLKLPQAIDNLSIHQPQGVRFAVEGQTLHALGAEHGTIRVYDLSGRLVVQGALQAGHFSLQGVNSGIYAVQLNTGDAKTTGSTLIRIQ